ncbi:MAG: primosomal protein [Cyanobacteria bacterium SBLK]|nr:primosomal protein [Cyanobacteria bacterium SBLK]
MSAVERKYKVRLAKRDDRIATKVGHAAREKLGKDIQAQLSKKPGSHSFDWNEWNTKVFPKILGKPDALKYPVEVIADALVLLYDSISEGTEEAISDLIEFNAASLKRRNELAKAQEEEDDDLDDLDDDEDEIDDLLDEEDEDDEDDGFDDEEEDDEDFDDEDDEDFEDEEDED